MMHFSYIDEEDNNMNHDIRMMRNKYSGHRYKFIMSCFHVSGNSYSPTARIPF